MIDFVVIFVLLHLVLRVKKVESKKGYYILYIFCYVTLKPFAWGVFVNDDYKIKGSYLFYLPKDDLETETFVARHATLLFPVWVPVYYFKSKTSQAKKYPFLSELPGVFKEQGMKCFDMNVPFSPANSHCRNLLEELYSVRKKIKFSEDLINHIWKVNLAKRALKIDSEHILTYAPRALGKKYKITVPFKCGEPREVFLYYALLDFENIDQNMLTYYNDMFTDKGCTGFSYSYHVSLREIIQSGGFFNLKMHNSEIIKYAYGDKNISHVLNSLYIGDVIEERKNIQHKTPEAWYYKLTACKYKPIYYFEDLERNCTLYFGYVEKESLNKSMESTKH